MARKRKPQNPILPTPVRIEFTVETPADEAKINADAKLYFFATRAKYLRHLAMNPEPVFADLALVEAVSGLADEIHQLTLLIKENPDLVKACDLDRMLVAAESFFADFADRSLRR
ncbi:MAG: hypothetical protein JJU07_03420 [Natronohydrobacter sp.]|nr:hypothetical protein [Natronohydrobacter sp.]